MESVKNSAELRGVAAGGPVFSHAGRDTSYFVFPLAAERLSGAVDTVNVIAPARLLDIPVDGGGKKLSVMGDLRSYNNRSGVGTRLLINVFARGLRFDDGEDVNRISLEGVICRPPIFRRTPMGREICDVMLAVARRYGRCDYLPVIVWGRQAEAASVWGPGVRVRVDGRLQSRKYIKTGEDGVSLEKTAFEVSATDICRCTDDGG